MSSLAIAQAYRWQRGLGHRTVSTPFARIVTDPDNPLIWDANHADTVTAEAPEEIEAVLRALETHLGHAPARVVHTDSFTPEAFSARLALDGYVERPAVIQMELCGEVQASRAADLRPVASEDDWAALKRLVTLDLAEGARTGGPIRDPAVASGMIANYRAKEDAYQFFLAIEGGEPAAYGARALAPGGAGMIEDLFTLPERRRRGLASGLVAALSHDLRSMGASCVFLGAVVGEEARRLYARLGFRPVMLTRTWILADGAMGKS